MGCSLVISPLISLSTVSSALHLELSGFERTRPSFEISL